MTNTTATAPATLARPALPRPSGPVATSPMDAGTATCAAAPTTGAWLPPQRPRGLRVPPALIDELHATRRADAAAAPIWTRYRHAIAAEPRHRHV